ncbi:MAG: type IV pilus twitching motility protein PilT [Candidatus Pacebacteria bacterium]|nr:type IV pilus twitching motility protein PilT [Candidatus Paceibacterota bacterium]
MDYQKQLKTLLEDAVKKGASDVHIVVGHPPVFRIAGQLMPQVQDKLILPEDAKGLAEVLMAQERQARFLQEKEIDFAYTLSEKDRLRVNIFFQMGYVSCALRLINSKIQTIEELNLPLTIKRFTEAEHGLVLITGASSQGKSTTLASLVDTINHKRKEHIITIEDPIEFIFQDDLSLIEQREIHQDTLSFARALRAALREDPDVIMVGEMRDLETIGTTITAAETGHLVFATLHTNSASQTIHRIIDVFPAHQQNQIRAQLAVSLLGVVSQHLIPANGHGFLPACEVMFNNSAVSNLIRENKIHEIPSVIETSFQAGMCSFNKSLLDLVKAGLISKEDALVHSLSPDDLKIRLGKI